MSESQYSGVIFMLGPGRCGNDFFRNILSASPCIHTLGPGGVNELWTSIANAPCGTLPKCEAMTETDLSEKAVVRIRNYFDFEYNKRNSIYNLIYRTYRKIKSGNGSILKIGDKIYILNKSAHMWNKIEFINALFPDSRFIWTVRDPYSHINSIYKHQKRVARVFDYYVSLPLGDDQCWSYKKNQITREKVNFNIKDVTEYWIRSNWHAINSLNSLESERVRIINFEDLVVQPNKILSLVQDFLDTEMSYKIDISLVNNLTNNPLKDWEHLLEQQEKDEIASVLEKNKDRVSYILESVQYPSND